MFPILRLLLAAVLLCAGQASAGDALTLHYDAPAQDWEKQALPIGNGAMGAMVFGEPVKWRRDGERIVFDAHGGRSYRLTVAAATALAPY